MSRHDYAVSQEITATDPPFAALVMAAYRKADTPNSVLLRDAFPEITAELVARYNSPGGLLPGERGAS